MFFYRRGAQIFSSQHFVNVRSAWHKVSPSHLACHGARGDDLANAFRRGGLSQ
jgi:hypothetical protein